MSSAEMTTTISRYEEACADYGVEAREDVKLAITDAINMDDHAIKFNRSHSESQFGQRLTDMDALPLFDALGDDTVITDLVLSYNEIGNMAVKGLASCLKRNVCLKHIDLSHNTIGPEGGEGLANVLAEHNVIVSSVILHGNPIGAMGGMAFAKMLMSTKNIDYLDLGRCDLDTNSVMSIADAVTSASMAGDCALYLLNLDSPHATSVQDEFATHLSTMLTVNNTIESLSLRGCMIQDDGVARLQEGLRNNQTLVRLDLSSNGITQPGGSHIARLLATNQHIRDLNLDSNRLGDEGALVIAEQLRSTTALQSLKIRSNCIHERGLIALAEGIAVNRSLTTVTIWGNEFGPSAAAQWAGLSDVKPNSFDMDVVAYQVDGAFKSLSKNSWLIYVMM